MQKTQCLGLHRAAQVKGLAFDMLGQIRDQRVGDFVPTRSIQNQPECAIRVMLANQNNGPMKERSAELASVQQQLTFERFEHVSETVVRLDGAPSLTR